MQRLAGPHRRKKKEVFRTAGHFALNDEPTQAIKVIDGYLHQIDPNDLDLLLLKGHILGSIHKFDQALNVYRKVLRVDRDNAPALIDLGGYFSNIKRNYRKALWYYARALRLVESGRFHLDEEDEFIDACTEKAGALLALKRPIEALKCIVHGLQKYPASLLLGDALQRAQKEYEAVRDRKFSKRYRTLKRQIAKLR